MPEPFKNLINADLVRRCGEHLQRHWRGFDRRGFERRALQGLDALEMKARAMQVADALEATLPDDFDRAAGILESALAPAATDDSLGFRTTDAGLAGWIGWPLGEFLARRGQADPERALLALRELTQRFTSEFAVRPFLLNHFDLTLAQLQRWSSDPSPHVRRWTSEGSRPRLPWGLQIKSLIADPSPTLPLLHALQDDPSPYVRRSVANHLNDIAKDHPGLVADWLEKHLPEAGAERKALLRHAIEHAVLALGDFAQGLHAGHDRLHLGLSFHRKCHAPQVEVAFLGIGRVRFAAEQDQVVGQEADRHVGEHHRVRAVGDLLVVHVLVVQIAALPPQPALGGLEVLPALHDEILVGGIGFGIDAV